jgi:hypothetical protein
MKRFIRVFAGLVSPRKDGFVAIIRLVVIVILFPRREFPVTRVEKLWEGRNCDRVS